VENPNEFWSNVSMAAVSPVAIAAGFAKGAYDASTDNRAFSEGFNAAAAPIMRAAKEFGAEHGTTLTKGVITGAAGVLGARIVKEGFKHLRI
jgi:ABC-type phosphate/phosphonate transport system permease subunit